MDAFNTNLRAVVGNLLVENLMLAAQAEQSNKQRDAMATELVAAREELAVIKKEMPDPTNGVQEYVGSQGN